MRTRVVISLILLVITQGGASLAQQPIGAPTMPPGQDTSLGTIGLTPGTPVNGRLQIGDETLSSGEFVDHYGLAGMAGQTFTLTLESTEFDPYLMVRGNGLRLDNDDVGQDNTNSQLQIYLPADGTYQVLVTSYTAGETGSYTLNVAIGTAVPIVPPAEAPQAVDISIGQPVQGQLEAGDAVTSTGTFADNYSFAGRFGQHVTITLQSEDLDPFLSVSGPNNFQTSNDDAPGLGLNSRLSLVLPADGNYLIQATSYAPGLTGRYGLLLVEEGETWSQGGPTPLNLGDTVEGTLAAGDTRLDSGEYVDRYPYQATAGEQLTISMQSTQLDSYLMVRGPNNYALDNDDVGEGNLNSEVMFTVPETGEYLVSATSYATGETGAYFLTLRQSGSVEVAPVGILAGQTIESELTSSDPLRSGGQYYRRYTFNGRAGQRAIVQMGSPSIDSFLILQAPNGDMETHDDIDSYNRNSRIELTLPVDGSYEIQASTYWSGETGPFTLMLSLAEDRMAQTAVPPVPIPEPTPEPIPGPTPGPIVITPPVTAPITAPGPEALVALGSTISGDLRMGDETLSSGELVDFFNYNGQRGQGFTVTLNSTQFDPYLIVRGPGEFSLDNDDGYAMGLNSQLELNLPEDGVYQIGATTYSPGESGAYTLSLVEGTSVSRTATGRIFAVLAGVSDYGGASDLAFCAEDAVKLRETLAKTGLLASESRLLINREVTRANLQAAFQQVAAAMGPNDVFLFFFSGHGNQLPGGGADELDGRNEALTLADGTDLLDDELTSMFAPIQARLSLIALDSCHAGGFARDVISAPNRMGLFSSEEDVTSNTAQRFQAGGYLSHFLRSGLEGAADMDPIDGMITVGELTYYLRRQWAANVGQERVETSEHQGTYQNLVIDRGTVKVTDVLVYSPQ